VDRVSFVWETCPSPFIYFFNHLVISIWTYRYLGIKFKVTLLLDFFMINWK
jgi:hypothetical protein